MQSLTSLQNSLKPVSNKSLLKRYTTVENNASLFFLEKATNGNGGQVTLTDIGKALNEYMRLFKAGIASDAEILTLARAYPSNQKFLKAAGPIDDTSVMVVGGPASIEMIDREGHLITTLALTKAFDKYMENFRTRNAMVLHSDVQVGWALPAYINKAGQIFKSGPTEKGLYFITEVRKDTKVSERVREQIDGGKLRSYSIAGTALKVENMTKGLMPYMQVDEMELAEVTVCEKGVNQGAAFDILKSKDSKQTGKISKDQCGYREATSEEISNNIMCGTCTYFNKGPKTCDTVEGIFDDEDYCNLFEPADGTGPTHPPENTQAGMEITIKLADDGTPQYVDSLLKWTQTHRPPRNPKGFEIRPDVNEMTEGEARNPYSDDGSEWKGPLRNHPSSRARHHMFERYESSRTGAPIYYGGRSEEERNRLAEEAYTNNPSFYRDPEYGTDENPNPFGAIRPNPNSQKLADDPTHRSIFKPPTSKGKKINESGKAFIPNEGNWQGRGTKKIEDAYLKSLLKYVDDKGKGYQRIDPRNAGPQDRMMGTTPFDPDDYRTSSSAYDAFIHGEAGRQALSAEDLARLGLSEIDPTLGFTALAPDDYSEAPHVPDVSDEEKKKVSPDLFREGPYPYKETKMMKAFTEWVSPYQIQRDVEADGSHQRHYWGAAGLADDSNIENLKNFVGVGK